MKQPKAAACLYITSNSLGNNEPPPFSPGRYNKIDSTCVFALLTCSFYPNMHIKLNWPELNCEIEILLCGIWHFSWLLGCLNPNRMLPLPALLCHKDCFIFVPFSLCNPPPTLSLSLAPLCRSEAFFLLWELRPFRERERDTSPTAELIGRAIIMLQLCVSVCVCVPLWKLHMTSASPAFISHPCASVSARPLLLSSEAFSSTTARLNGASEEDKPHFAH